MQPGHATRVKIESKRYQSPNVAGHSGATSPAPLVEGDEPEDSRGTSVVNQSGSASSSDGLGTLTSVLEQLRNRADKLSVDRDRQSGASIANPRQGEGKAFVKKLITKEPLNTSMSRERAVWIALSEHSENPWSLHNGAASQPQNSATSHH